MFTDKQAVLEEFVVRPVLDRKQLDDIVLAEAINKESSGEAIGALFVVIVCGAIVGVAWAVVHFGG